MIKLYTWQSGSALLIGLAIIISGVKQLVIAAPPSDKPPFTDIQDNWFKSCITPLTDQSIINNYPNSAFRPSLPVTQAKFAGMVDIDAHSNYQDYIATTTFPKMVFLSRYPSKIFHHNQNISPSQVLLADDTNAKYLKSIKLASWGDESAFLCQAASISEQNIAGTNIAARTNSEYYVSVNGSDKGKGTQSSPWRTLNKALSSVSPNQGHTIRVGAGTFDLGGKVSIPSGIKLLGSGLNSTTIMGELQIRGVKNLTISGMKLSGNNYKYNTAVYIRDSSKINIQNIAFNKYKSQAINIERVSDSEISNLDIFDCTFNEWKAGGGGKQSRAIDLGNLTNVKFHDITINTLTRGGQGIGSDSDAWRRTDNVSEDRDTILRNVSFYNLDIKVDKFNSWWNGWTTQMALELFGHKCYKCEIYNSTFNSTVSLATNPNREPTSVRVHHNLWQAAPDKPFYAIEVNNNNVEFDHNYVRGGAYPIASFGNDYRNLNVHHNVFEKTKEPALVALLEDKRDNFKFVNNTVYIDNSELPLFDLRKGEAANQQIRNNIFYNSSKKINNNLKASVGLDNNLFFRIKPAGSRAITLDPKLRLSGSSPSEYYRPRTDSAIIKRNIGAIQADSPAWIVGKRTSTARRN